METNLKYKLKDFEENDDKHTAHETRSNSGVSNKKACPILPSLPPVYSLTHHETSPETSNQKFDRRQSSQVMKYYYEYSQNSNLSKYFSLPAPDTERYEYHWKNQEETSSKFLKNQKVSYEHKDVTTCTETLKEKIHLIRPPLIGQPSRSTTEKATNCDQTPLSTESFTEVCVELSSQDEMKDNRKDDDEKIMESVGLMTESIDRDVKIISPTSSVASHNKPLEWDSWADVGYYNTLPSAKEKPSSILHAIEKAALMRNLDTTSLRLDPEGTTGTSLNSFNRNTKTDCSLSKDPRQFSKPDANSTRFIDDVSELTSEMKITPIVKSNVARIITENINTDDDGSSRSFVLSDKSNRPCDKLPFKGKKYKLIPIFPPDKNQENSRCTINKINNAETLVTNPHYMLKRNASMHELVMPITAISLKRSQSELNLRGPINPNRKDSPIPFNFLSTSSITTIINKPVMCDKIIQTNLNEDDEQKRESKATQASSVIETKQMQKKNCEEDFKNLQNEHLYENNQIKSDIEDPVVLEETCYAKKKTLQPILKNNESNSKNSIESKIGAFEGNQSFRSVSQEEADGGRASNSFEYFPGHIYQNVHQGGSTSHTSSINTERSHSTMPNTSSSLDEKLWGDSDSLLRDLERSLSILKSLVNTNKCDKQIKKRLIHHVIKRLVTARYTDDRIERNLEENVPWNPDNARNKIYCTEIIQALAKKQNHDSTEDSVENWKLDRQTILYNKKALNRDTKFSDMIHFASSEDSDAFEERTTDRTDGMQDGRKARLGLRSDDKYNHPRHHHKYQINDRTISDTDKSESSECFFPQSQNIKRKGKVPKKVSSSEIMQKASLSPTLSGKTNTVPITNTMSVPTTISKITNPNIVTSNIATTAIATSTNVTVITSHETTASISTTSKSSNNQSKNQSVIDYKDVDWRLPATVSERRFNYEKDTKLGTMSRLIDYVEMEKKNQLVWINNEINHLLNLKKLLEEPVKAKKHKEVDLEQEKLVNGDKKDKYQHVENNVLKSKMLKDQWSSHGNIAAVCNKKNVAPKKKKNCYTQTNVNNDAVKLLKNDEVEEVFTESVPKVASVFSTYTQTMKSNSEQSSTSASTESNYQLENRNINCQCQDLGLHSQQIGTQTVNELPKNDFNDDQRPVITQLVVNSKKETKNILNDSRKSEFTVVENQEQFNELKNHCRGCSCGRIRDKLPKTSKNEHRTEVSKISGAFCICGVQRENVVDKNRLKQTEDNELRRRLETKEKAKNEEKLRKHTDVRCKTCGIFYTATKNRKCQCTRSYEKSIAYELSFEDKNYLNHDNKPVQLKDYLKMNKPEFVDNVEMRKQYMVEISQLRQMKKEKIMQLLALASPSESIIKPKAFKRSAKLRRKISEEEMKMRLRLKYQRLNEVRNKCRQQEKLEQLRHNHLMAKIYCKKLQQKVLQGRVTLSQSVSVISNI